MTHPTTHPTTSPLPFTPSLPAGLIRIPALPEHSSPPSPIAHEHDTPCNAVSTAPHPPADPCPQQPSDPSHHLDTHRTPHNPETMGTICAAAFPDARRGVLLLDALLHNQHGNDHPHPHQQKQHDPDVSYRGGSRRSQQAPPPAHAQQLTQQLAQYRRRDNDIPVAQQALGSAASRPTSIDLPQQLLHGRGLPTAAANGHGGSNAAACDWHPSAPWADSSSRPHDGGDSAAVRHASLDASCRRSSYARQDPGARRRSSLSITTGAAGAAASAGGGACTRPSSETRATRGSLDIQSFLRKAEQSYDASRKGRSGVEAEATWAVRREASVDRAWRGQEQEQGQRLEQGERQGQGHGEEGRQHEGQSECGLQGERRAQTQPALPGGARELLPALPPHDAQSACVVVPPPCGMKQGEPEQQHQQQQREQQREQQADGALWPAAVSLGPNAAAAGSPVERHVLPSPGGTGADPAPLAGAGRLDSLPGRTRATRSLSRLALSGSIAAALPSPPAPSPSVSPAAGVGSTALGPAPDGSLAAAAAAAAATVATAGGSGGDGGGSGPATRGVQSTSVSDHRCRPQSQTHGSASRAGASRHDISDAPALPLPPAPCLPAPRQQPQQQQTGPEPQVVKVAGPQLGGIRSSGNREDVPGWAIGMETGLGGLRHSSKGGVEIMPSLPSGEVALSCLVTGQPHLMQDHSQQGKAGAATEVAGGRMSEGKSLGKGPAPLVPWVSCEKRSAGAGGGEVELLGHTAATDSNPAERTTSGRTSLLSAALAASGVSSANSKGRTLTAVEVISVAQQQQQQQQQQPAGPPAIVVHAAPCHPQCAASASGRHVSSQGPQQQPNEDTAVAQVSTCSSAAVSVPGKVEAARTGQGMSSSCTPGSVNHLPSTASTTAAALERTSICSIAAAAAGAAAAGAPAPAGGVLANCVLQRAAGQEQLPGARPESAPTPHDIPGDHNTIGEGVVRAWTSMDWLLARLRTDVWSPASCCPVRIAV